MSFWKKELAVLAMITHAASAEAQAPPLEANNDRAIEVTGEASVSAKPDFAIVTLGVTSTGKDAGEAMATNARSVSSLIATLKDQGVAPADIQTSSLSIAPQFSNPGPGGANRQTIVGYTATNMVTVTARDLGNLGRLIDKAVAEGANAMYGIAYGQNNPGALLDKARPNAVADARHKAEIYAAAAGAKVGRLMWLTDQTSPAPVAFAPRVGMQAAAAPTPIEPGEDKLTVTVSARFELTQ